ncbi:MAG: flagellar hook-basal body complex protein FliE [Acidimicrobiia bacterium]|jgi:flagellar hook-basal body complex protein FliE
MTVKIGALSGPLSGVSPVSGGGGKGFEAVFRETLQQASAAVGKAEMAGRDAALSSVDAHEVAAALTDAETMVESLVAIRDKLVAAYNELVRTPI